MIQAEQVAQKNSSFILGINLLRMSHRVCATQAYNWLRFRCTAIL
ncbi:hypothetical protein BD293_1900 [Roseinatronobacter monicus]|uniref:Uncharacterized protein n=1 Tax=Roseinatronobacter monicus TaxID=393481 RepID=A0A543KDX2_9RHOB|nr:hypothetical protein BD293_1900 [Roseinatronobacter monicus]